jgi:hypothetical protein
VCRVSPAAHNLVYNNTSHHQSPKPKTTKKQIRKLQAGDYTPDVMLGRQTLLNCAAFHKMGEGCNGGDAIDVFHYMGKFGLPDESCLHYAATDHTEFKEKGMERCPADKFCVNCMPKPTKKDPDAYECWPVKKPVMYTVRMRCALAVAVMCCVVVGGGCCCVACLWQSLKGLRETTALPLPTPSKPIPSN